jgi:hypothetical protein
MSKSTISPRCEKCAFLGQHLHEIWWICRRKPPVVPADPSNRSANWPVTEPDDWCGEFQPGERGIVTCR